MSEFITIASFMSPAEAHIAKGRLEAEGVPALIANEHHISATWFLSNALGGVKVLVLNKYKNEAEKIIKAHISGEFEETLEQEFTKLESNTCKECESKNIKNKFSLWLLLLSIISLGLASIIFPIRRDRHQCQNCGCKWKY